MDLDARAASLATRLVAGPPERCGQARLIDDAGFYAWWALPDALNAFDPKVPAAHPTGSPPHWSLLYVGISPDSERGGSTVMARVRSHLEGKVERSTVRYTIAALMPSLNLSVVGTTPNRKKPRLATETPLTKWIEGHCWLTMTKEAAPWTPGLEERVIHILRPPLNGTFSLHPFRATVVEARGAMLARARAASGDT